MGMSIDEALEHGKEQIEIFGGEHKEFIECAIETMRKYKKVEEIVKEWREVGLDYDSCDAMDNIERVIEDGNVANGEVVGTGVRGTWTASTPLNKAYSDMIEALQTAKDTIHKYQQLQADYENRLKADIEAVLVDLQLEIREHDPGCGWEGYADKNVIDCIIQQKINELETKNEGKNE